MNLVNPRQRKNVSGRKSDGFDASGSSNSTPWTLTGAFRPNDEICVLRSYLRQRAMLVSYASHHMQHIEKALEQMNVNTHGGGE